MTASTAIPEKAGRVAAPAGLSTVALAKVEASRAGSVPNAPWPVVRLADFTAKIGSGSTPRGGEAVYRESGTPLIRSMNIHFGGFKADGLAHIDEVEASKLSNVIVQAGDVLLNITGASIGRVTTAPEEMRGARVNQHVCIIRPTPEISSRFLALFFASPEQQARVMNVQVGATRQALTKAMIERWEVPVPPLPEQRRIVAEIEKQFTRLDAGIAALRRTQANLKRYRAAVLKAACEGRLVPTEAELAKQPSGKRGSIPRKSGTPDFESGAMLLERILYERRKSWKGRGKFKEATAGSGVEAPSTSLPGSWTWARLDSLCSLENGDRSSNYPSRSAFVETGIPFINAGHLENGAVQMDEMNFISEERYQLLRAGKVRPNDLLFCLRGSLGKTAIVQTIDRGAIASSLVILRPAEGVLHRYLLSYLQSPLAREDIGKYDNGSAQPNLSASDLGKFLIPLPPLAEQTRIVAEVERRLSVVEELETVVNANLQRATRLRQSILQQAFAGQLN